VLAHDGLKACLCCFSQVVYLVHDHKVITMAFPPPSPKTPQAKKPEASANPQQSEPQNLQPPAQGQQIAQRQPLAQPQTAVAPIAPANASTAPKQQSFPPKH